MLVRVIKYHYHPPPDRRDSRINACYESQSNVPLSYPCPGNILCQSKDGTQAHSEQWRFPSHCSIRLIPTEIAAWGGPPGAVTSFSHTLLGERDVVFHPTPPSRGARGNQLWLQPERLLHRCSLHSARPSNYHPRMPFFHHKCHKNNSLFPPCNPCTEPSFSDITSHLNSPNMSPLPSISLISPWHVPYLTSLPFLGRDWFSLNMIVCCLAWILFGHLSLKIRHSLA